MFSYDEMLKPHVLQRISEIPSAHFFVEQYWDQLVLYLLLLPLEWIHVLHMLHCTEWNRYGAFGKLFTIHYMAIALIVWEVARIGVFYAIRGAIESGDIRVFATHVIARAQELFAKGMVVAKPYIAKIRQSVTNLAEQAQHSATELVNRQRSR